MLDREKAAKVAMLLTSNQPGEVVAAAGRLVAMLSAVGMTPSDLVLKPDTDASTRSPSDTFALHIAREEIRRLKETIQRERASHEEMLRQRERESDEEIR